MAGHAQNGSICTACPTCSCQTGEGFASSCYRHQAGGCPGSLEGQVPQCAPVRSVGGPARASALESYPNRWESGLRLRSPEIAVLRDTEPYWSTVECPPVLLKADFSLSVCLSVCLFICLSVSASMCVYARHVWGWQIQTIKNKRPKDKSFRFPRGGRWAHYLRLYSPAD